MSKYYTPIEVANVLSGHIPKKLNRILEPSVGNGVLLEPLRGKLQHCDEVICLDINKIAINNVEKKFRSQLGSNLETHHLDFLEWSESASAKSKFGTFDCVLMNPPFSAKKKSGFFMEFPSTNLGGCEEKFMSIEIAFMLKSIELIRSGGRILAILPSSPISSVTTKWFREYLLKIGSILCVHELPKNTFPGVDGQVFILVFEKGNKHPVISVCNHRLVSPEIALVNVSSLSSELRLDYSYNISTNFVSSLKKSSYFLNWVSLSEICTLTRGSVKSPISTKKAIHTTDYSKGFWNSGSTKIVKIKSKFEVRSSDILVQRVGRGCAKSFGVKLGNRSIAASDCTIIIRPKKNYKNLRILFSLRSIYASEIGQGLLERGVCARYISLEELGRASIPMIYSKNIEKLFLLWKRKVKILDFDAMKAIEIMVRQQMAYVN